MSSDRYHAVIWIDLREARVFHFSPTAVDGIVLHPDRPTQHIHHKANSIGSGHAAADHDYLHAVAVSVADAGAILITGPASANRIAQTRSLPRPQGDESHCGGGNR